MSSRPLFGALTTVGFAVPSLLLALFSVIFNSVMNDHTMNADTLRNWTCRFDKSMPIVGLNIPEKLSNEQFGMLCTELVRIPNLSYAMTELTSSLEVWRVRYDWSCGSGVSTRSVCHRPMDESRIARRLGGFIIRYQHRRCFNVEILITWEITTIYTLKGVLGRVWALHAMEGFACQEKNHFCLERVSGAFSSTLIVPNVNDI